MRILVKFPTRGRKDKFFKVLDLYYSLASDIDMMLFEITLDKDDDQMNNLRAIEKLQTYKNLNFTFGVSKNKIHAINRDLDKYKEWDIVLLASDDMVPKVKGYDQIIRDNMKKHYPDTDGVLWFNDGLQGSNLNTLVICGKKYFERDRYLYNPIYETLMCDVEFMEVARMRGKQKYFNQVIIKHEHIGYAGNMDETARKNNNWGKDTETLNKRKLENFGMNTPKPIQETKTFYFHNAMRLGDGIFFIQYLRRLCELYPNYIFWFYINSKLSNFYELEKHIGKYAGRIILSELSVRKGISIDCWIGDNRFYYTHANREILNEFYYHYFEMLSKKIGVQNPIQKDWKFEHENIIDSNKFEYDILVINSRAMSGQAAYNKLDILNFVNKHRDSHRIITTDRIEGFPCTRDHNLSTLEIGILSTKCKYIIGYNTSPIIACLNEFTLKNCEAFYYIDTTTGFNYPKMIKINSFSEVDFKKKIVIEKKISSSDIDIYVTTFKRPEITKICIDQIEKTKQGATLNIYNDEIDKIGIEKQRVVQMNDFIKKDKNFMYLTDNDCFHDSNFIDVLIYYFEKYNLPVSLYRSNNLVKSKQISENDEVVFTGHCPGASMLLSKEMVKIILGSINKIKTHTSWDWKVCEILKTFIVTKTSFVQHFGENGLHSSLGKDEAVNPTEYLKIKTVELC